MKRKKDKQKGSIEIDELKELSIRNPVKTWVNFLFMHMSKNHLENFTLKKSQGIPSIPLEDQLPEGELDFTKIINRLKVMSIILPKNWAQN